MVKNFLFGEKCHGEGRVRRKKTDRTGDKLNVYAKHLDKLKEINNTDPYDLAAKDWMSDHTRTKMSKHKHFI